MFGKLIKNELKTGFHSIMGIYLAAIIACGLVILTMFFDNGLSKGIGFVLCGVLVIMAIVAFVVTVVKSLTNYANSMYGQQGYLTFTLPAKASSLYFSKMTAAFFWTLIGYAFVLGSVVLWFWYLLEELFATMVPEEYAGLVKELAGSLMGINVDSLITVVVIYLVIAFVIALLFLTTVMFSISLGTTKAFQQRSGLWAFIFSAGIFILILWFTFKIIYGELGEFFGLFVTIGVDNKIDFVFESPGKDLVPNVAGTIFQILIMIGLSTGNIYLIENKVNIK